MAVAAAAALSLFFFSPPPPPRRTERHSSSTIPASNAPFFPFLASRVAHVDLASLVMGCDSISDRVSAPPVGR